MDLKLKKLYIQLSVLQLVETDSLEEQERSVREVIKPNLKMNQEQISKAQQIHDLLAKLYCAKANTEIKRYYRFNDARESLAQAKKYALSVSTLQRINKLDTELREDELKEKKRLNLQLKNINKGQAEDLCKKGNYEEAQSWFNGALTFAEDSSAILEIQQEKADCMRKQIDTLAKEAERLGKDMKKFDQAKSKFQEALNLINRDYHPPGKYQLIEWVRFLVTSSMDRVDDAHAQVLQAEARASHAAERDTEALKQLSEAANLAKTKSIQSSIANDRREILRLKANDEQAERAQAAGKQLVAENKFAEADRSFESALSYAARKSLVKSIEKDRRQAMIAHTKLLRNEAGALADENKFREAYDKLREATDVALEDSLVESIIIDDKKKIVGKHIKQLRKEAADLVEKNQFDKAHAKLDEAMELAITKSQIKELGSDKADVYAREGEAVFKKGLALEMEDKWQESDQSFERALVLLKNTTKYKFTKAYEKSIEIVRLKMKGDGYADEALEIEDEAFGMYKKAKRTEKIDDYLEAQNRYRDARQYYKEGKKEIEKARKLGCKEMQATIDMIEEAITGIDETVKNFDTIKLKYDALEWKKYEIEGEIPQVEAQAS